jgi:hypothetical protein
MVKSFSGLTDEIVNSVIAEELRWCWYQFLEGKRAILDRRNWISLNMYSPKLCFLCTEVTFDSSVSQNLFTGFFQYTQDETMLDSEMTYYDYYAAAPRLCDFYTRTAPETNCWEAFFADKITKNNPAWTPEATSFQKNTKYNVLFIMQGLPRPPHLSIVIEGEVDNFAYVLPESELQNQCDSLIRGPVG